MKENRIVLDLNKDESMTSYYPGDLTPITGNPDDIFLCDPIEEAASEYLQSEAKRRKEIIAQIEKADAIKYQLNTGIYIIVSPSFEPDYAYRVTYMDSQGPYAHNDFATAAEVADEIGENAVALEAVII